MTALANSVTVPSRNRGRNVYDLLATQQVRAGGLIGLTAAGFAVPWDNVATTTFLGMCLEDALEPADDVCKVNDEGLIITNIPIASGLQTSVGAEVFCTTDNVLTDCALTATSLSIGVILRFRSAADMDIQLYTPTEWLAKR